MVTSCISPGVVEGKGELAKYMEGHSTVPSAASKLLGQDEINRVDLTKLMEVPFGWTMTCKHKVNANISFKE